MYGALVASIDLGHNLKLDGDYVQTLYKMSYNGKKLLNNPTMWTLGLTYGEVDTDMPGSYSFGIRYVDACIQHAWCYRIGSRRPAPLFL